MMQATEVVVEFASMFESGRRAVCADLKRNFDDLDKSDVEGGWHDVRRVVGAGLAESIMGCQTVASELGRFGILLIDMRETCEWVSDLGCAISEAQEIADELAEGIGFEEPE